MGSSKSLPFLVACLCTVACTLHAWGCNDQRASSLESPARAEIATGLTLRLNVAGRSDVFACGRGFTAAQVEEDQVHALKNAPDRCQGSEGGFLCSCDGEERTSYAFGCVAALYEACEVEAEPVDGSGDDEPFALECEASVAGVAGRCAQRDDGSYACNCGDDAHAIEPDPEAAGSAPTACEQALFEQCAEPCQNDFGACAATDSGVLGEYSCACSTNGLSHVVRAGSCAESLDSACSLLHETDSFCTGYGGACVVADPDQPKKLTCTCIDRAVEVVDFVPRSDDLRVHACRDVLEATCGLGAPPDNAQCTVDDNGWHARCSLGPDDDSSFSCECYEDGANEARTTSPTDIDCNEATLRELCPELGE